VPIYIAKVWRRGYDAECTAVNGWIADLIAADPTYVFLGIDESVLVKGDDDGVTYTADGVHYNDAGDRRVAAGWSIAIGKQ
jgi:hypothetical protein